MPMWWWQYIPRAELGPARAPVQMGAAVPSIALPAPTSAIAMPTAVSDVEAGAPAAGFDLEAAEHQRRTVLRNTTGRPINLNIPRGILPVVGGFLGPIGRLIGTLLDLLVGAANRAASAAPGTSGPVSVTGGTADRSGQPDLTRLTEQQIRDMARAAGAGDAAAQAAIDLWREQQRAASAARLAEIDRLLAELAQPEPVADTGAGGGGGVEEAPEGEIAIPEGVEPETSADEWEPPFGGPGPVAI